MREILSIHVGQCGIQVGNKTWELFCLEHGISPDGHIYEGEGNFEFMVLPEQQAKRASFSTFFSESSDRYTPRALMVDLDNGPCDHVQYGTFRNLYESENILSSGMGSGMNFARGHLAGKGLLEITLERIRKLADSCDDCGGFMLYHSMSGGVGSGFTALLMERLAELYRGKERVTVSLQPSNTLTSGIIEPYNYILSLSNLIEYADVTFCVDNKGLHNMCQSHWGIEQPTYHDINQLLAQVMSSITAPLRNDGSLFGKLSEFRQGLVPCPRLQFVLPSYCQAQSLERTNDSLTTTPLTVPEMTRHCCTRSSSLADCDIRTGKCMAVALMYRGSIVPRDVSTAVASLKVSGNLRFVDWTPTGLKCGIDYSAAICFPGGNHRPFAQSVCVLANSSAHGDLISAVSRKFDRMYRKRAFVHWFVREGMEEGEIFDARMEVAKLEQDYKEVVREEPDDAYEEDLAEY